MTARVAIDPNVRVRGDQTYAGLEDVRGDVAAGSRVEVYERESGLTWPAQVTEVDRERQLVYLAVDWGQLHEPPGGGRPPGVFAELVRRAQLAFEAIRRHLPESSRQRVP